MSYSSVYSRLPGVTVFVTIGRSWLVEHWATSGSPPHHSIETDRRSTASPCPTCRARAPFKRQRPGSTAQGHIRPSASTASGATWVRRRLDPRSHQRRKLIHAPLNFLDCMNNHIALVCLIHIVWTARGHIPGARFSQRSNNR